MLYFDIFQTSQKIPVFTFTQHSIKKLDQRTNNLRVIDDSRITKATV